MQTTVERLNVIITGRSLLDGTFPAPNPAQYKGEPVSLKLTDPKLDTILAALPGYYTESCIGHGVISLLYQAMLRMLGQGRSDVEIVAMFQQAIEELRLGLEHMDCRPVMVH